MKVDWNINYQFKIAKCSQMTVALREVDKPTIQVFRDAEIGFGFTKYKSGKLYQGYIISMSDELFNKTKKEPDILANYGSQLGDNFNEYHWQDELIGDTKRLLGRFPKQQELADYLGVNKATVSGYSDTKKKLWLNGFWLLRKIKT